ncbi:MAG: hypothetical protein RMM51_11580, partial [Verrucomicrobiae bacterium]|nr:hypothetical protein [Verrucomicrobiae bacterium]
WIARPHLFTLLCLVLWNSTLRREPSWRWYAGLPALMALWVNLHGGFLAGFITLGCYWVGALWERDWRRWRACTVVGVLSVIASLLNPSGYRLHWHNLQFVRNQFFTDWLAEYASADFHNPAHAGFLLVLLAVWGAIALAPHRCRPTDVILTLVWGYFALYSVRNIPLFAIIVTPIIAPAWSAFLPVAWHERTTRWVWLRDARAGWLLAIAGLAWLVTGVDRTTEMPADKFPVRAVEYIRTHPEQFNGRMFNQYIWGGYLLIALPEHPVFIDGRADFFGEEHVRTFDRVTDLQPGWAEPLEKYEVRWTLMPPDHRLNAALALAGWQKIYEDKTAVIYRR